MKQFYSVLFALIFGTIAFAQQTISYAVSPPAFNEDESITITFSGINEATWGVSTSHALYLWAWSYDSATNTSMDCPTNGAWASSSETNRLTYVSPGVYSITFVPTTFYNRTGLGRIAFLVKTKTGSVQSQDIIIPVGRFQMTLTNPTAGSTSVVNSGTAVNITATGSLPAFFELKANGTTVHTTTTASTAFSYNYTVSGDAQMELIGKDAADPTAVQSKTFGFLITPVVQSAPIPSYMRQGITYDPADPTKVGLALYAPLKNYVHVIGSFNNWTLSSNYLMKKDTTNPDLYWLEVTGLIPQQVYTFQYRTNDGVKVADPYSTLVLSPDDDPYISASIYPNLPAYPAGQKFDVSVVQTAKPAYNWQVTNFAKPAKDNLIVYEVLLRDFTEEKSWQSLIDKLSYIKSLNVNAIELMPIMEFDGNNSWGYNPGFHAALDKAYGTPEKFKEFVDICHQNGLAVILDIALNHATGRSPLERLWMIDSGNGYGPVAANNPYFNQSARHSYSVFYDFNHAKPETRYYVNRVLEQWISEYKIDGFRWDLTKGFTQNCTDSNESCTNSYQQDRVDVLKLYSDYQWSHDPTSYIIFEHLGTDAEEQQWANYRINEGKGVIMWDKLTDPYNQNTMGFATNSNFNRVDFENHGFAERRNVSYAESHDEERIMFKNLNFGNASGSYDVQSLSTGLMRQRALGAVLLTVPGPKMIWQFGELGYDFSINRCENGSISNDCRTSPKPVAFTLNYHNVTNRKAVYDTWAKILQIRLTNEVFNTKTFTVESGNLMPRIFIWNDNLPASSLKNVVILANFTLTSQNIVPDFPYAGNWYNLMTNATISVSDTAAPITIEAGGFRIFGNQSALATDEVVGRENKVSLKLTSNPVQNGVATLRFSNAKNGVFTLYDLSGKALKSIKVKKETGEENISVSDLKAGIYLIQLSSDEGSAAVKMIVK